MQVRIWEIPTPYWAGARAAGLCLNLQYPAMELDFGLDCLVRKTVLVMVGSGDG